MYKCVCKCVYKCGVACIYFYQQEVVKVKNSEPLQGLYFNVLPQCSEVNVLLARKKQFYR